MGNEITNLEGELERLPRANSVICAELKVLNDDVALLART